MDSIDSVYIELHGKAGGPELYGRIARNKLNRVVEFQLDCIAEFEREQNIEPALRFYEQPH